MMNEKGFDPATDEYTIAGAMEALECSKATLDRWIPPGTEGRRRTQALPGKPAEVRISGVLVRQFVPTPGGDE